MKLTESAILKRCVNKEDMKSYRFIILCSIIAIANICLSLAIAAEKLAPAGSKQGPEIFVQMGYY